MSDSNKAAELLAWAREYANAQHDLYALLGISPSSSSSSTTSDGSATTTTTTTKISGKEVHRAWRKASLRHHPDKAGDDFDPELWQRFERARDVLADPAARDAYDAARAATLRRGEQRRAMDAKRRAMVDDLERREREAAAAGPSRKKARTDDGAGAATGMPAAEMDRLREAGRRRIAERERLIREAEDRDRLRQRALGKEEEEEEQDGSSAAAARKQPDTGNPANDIPASRHPEPAAATRSPNGGGRGGGGGGGGGGGEGDKGDDYDQRIADLERRLRENQELKAQKAARKAARKAGRSAAAAAEAAEGGQDPAVPKSRGRGEEKKEKQEGAGPADSNGNAQTGLGNGTTAAAAAAAPPSSSSCAPQMAPAAPSAPAKGGFASTMARLRAAQAEKEARKAAAEAEAGR